MSQGLEKSTVKDYKVFRTVTVAERIKKLSVKNDLWLWNHCGSGDFIQNVYCGVMEAETRLD